MYDNRFFWCTRMYSTCIQSRCTKCAEISPTSCTMTQGLGLSLVNTVYRKSRDRFSFRGGQKTSAGVQYLKEEKKRRIKISGRASKGKGIINIDQATV